MAPNDEWRVCAAGDGRLHVWLLSQRQHHPADQTGNAWDFDYGNSEDDIAYRAAGQCHQRDCQQNRRYGHQTVHHPHDYAVEPANEAGDQADSQSNDRCGDGDAKAYCQ